MKKQKRLVALLSSASLLLIIFAGCTINGGSFSNEKFQRTDQLQTDLAPGSKIDVKTSFGSINIHGDDVTKCFVEAVVTAHAPTIEEAEQIAQKTSIDLDMRGNTLYVKVNKPRLDNNRSVSTSFDITVPQQTDVKCNTSYGSIELTNIKGNINGHTSFASITCKDTKGDLSLNTSYGSITCRDINSGLLKAYSSFGGIDIDFTDSSPSDVKAVANTSYGSINMVAPNNFAGIVELSTSFGGIKTDLPITVKGRIAKEHITGQVGQGDGKIDLKTSFGAIHLK